MEDFKLLVEQAQAGNQGERRDAFDALMPHFQKMAFRVAYNTLQDVHMAEDVVQEAFLNAYLRIEQLRDPQAFPAWLKKIVLTQCDRLIRGKRPKFETIETHYDIAIENPSPEALVEESEMQYQVLYAIESLPENEREVTKGFYMSGQSQKEIAERLQVPVTTVKKRLQYAREHLRLIFDDLNTVVDTAIAHVLQANPPAEPQPQPVYIYSQQVEPASDEIY